MWPFNKKQDTKQGTDWFCYKCKTTREWIDVEWRISNISDLYDGLCVHCGKFRAKYEKQLAELAALVAGGMAFTRDMRGEFYSVKEISDRSFQIAQALLSKKQEISEVKWNVAL